MTSVLVLNAGSSSLKFALLSAVSGERTLSGLAERLGTKTARLVLHHASAPTETMVLDDATHSDAVDVILETIRGLGADVQPVGVGHRVVHGGDLFSDSVLITTDVIEAISRFSALAPLHNPPALLGIEAIRNRWPGVPQVAVFDTAFHQTMPPAAYRYAIPEEWYTDHHVRRYGFHGTSHRYVSGRAAELLGRAPDELALVVCHLGNGCSATAVLGGRSVDTTMGLTPLEGLVMGTRSGDVDPGIFDYLESGAGMKAPAVTDSLNRRSGLLGLSGRSNDMREVSAAAAAGDERAVLAMEVFVYRLAKAVAGLVVGLGRIDALVFTGGIGENNPTIRSQVVGALGFLGLSIDEDGNAAHGALTQGRISMNEGPAVLVVPTDEELMIALDTSRITAELATRGQR